jgi:hypothetical protein
MDQVTLVEDGAQRLNRISEAFRSKGVPVSGKSEPSRIIEYACKLGGPPVVIRDTNWKGLFLGYALVAGVPSTSVAVA